MCILRFDVAAGNGAVFGPLRMANSTVLAEEATAFLSEAAALANHFHHAVGRGPLHAPGNGRTLT